MHPPLLSSAAGLGAAEQGRGRHGSARLHEAHSTQQDVCQTQHNSASAVTIFSPCPHFHAVLKDNAERFHLRQKAFHLLRKPLLKRLPPFISVIIIVKKKKRKKSNQALFANVLKKPRHSGEMPRCF